MNYLFIFIIISMSNNEYHYEKYNLPAYVLYYIIIMYIVT